MKKVVLKGILEEKGERARVWCPLCRQNHVHSVTFNNGKLVQWLVCGCPKGKGFNTTEGYLITLYTPAEVFDIISFGKRHHGIDGDI